MAWLLLVLFIGIGCLFAISSSLDAPSSPNTIPIPEDTASERPLLSRSVKYKNSIFDDASIATEINPATGMVMMNGTGGVDAGGNPWGISSFDDTESIIDTSSSLDSLDIIDS